MKGNKYRYPDAVFDEVVRRMHKEQFVARRLLVGKAINENLVASCNEEGVVVKDARVGKIFSAYLDKS